MDTRFVPMDGGVPDVPEGRRVALLPAGGDLWEDFLDSISVPLDRFCAEGPGGWMSGYMAALNSGDVTVVLIFFSARVRQVTRHVDPATGNAIVLLPVPRRYRALRRRLAGYRSPADRPLPRPPGRSGRLVQGAHAVAPHLSTPIAALARELRRWQCRAILCQEYEYFRFDLCVVLGRLLRLPVFATFQGADRDHNPLSRRLKRSTVGRAAGLFIAAGDEIARVRETYGDAVPPIRQVFNPVDLEEWAGGAVSADARPVPDRGPSTRVAVWHGRIAVYTKGLDLLLRAWEEVCAGRRGQDLRLLLMGAGPDEDEWRGLLASSAAPGVHWVDEYVSDRDAIRRFLTSGDVYVFPSRLEGFPVAPLEAMACGLPVVAAAASGVPDILGTGDAFGGLVVPREDAGALAAALGRVLDDDGYRAELGHRALRRAQSAFSLVAVGAQLRAALLGDRVGPGGPG